MNNSFGKFCTLIWINIKEAFTENKKLLLISVLLFLVSAILACVFVSSIDSGMGMVIHGLKKQLATGQIKLTYDSIFLSNFKVTLMMYFVGILFGIITAVLMILNGMIIGYVLGKGPFLVVLLYILPHGILEFPALIFSCTAGFTLFKFINRFIKNIRNPDNDYINHHYINTPGFSYNKDDKLSFKTRVSISYHQNNRILVQSLTILIVAIILLLIAAYIEVYITPGLAKHLVATYHLQ
ncbi:hypothetical protein BGI41_07410 [Methanobrevibacter sp. 87.7]|uniref:stage II sporulation protein M n=1 Tax=Methanobrevibacter sp. 87.7 TaxID=387957 RepID=UPI000B676B8A|nr:stage II sporulation protein M [Methanobrevibacter sp. 87.7]OWT32486.1 hypothetical protein BGI41_07410 [Methanobrevibacter sp. 87.7]